MEKPKEYSKGYTEAEDRILKSIMQNGLPTAIEKAKKLLDSLVCGIQTDYDRGVFDAVMDFLTRHKRAN